MPTDVELELRDLAARSGAPAAAPPGLDGLEQEVQGEPRSRGADPVQEAFRSLEAVATSITRPFGGRSKRASTSTSDSERITSDQAAAYGGNELLNAFRSQDQLNTETFSQRVRLASLLDPEHLDKLQTYRDKLDVYDRQLFDEGFFPRFGEAVTTEVQRQMDIARGGSGVFMSAYERKPTYYRKGDVTIPYKEGQPAPVGATAHFYDSPKQEELLRKFAEETGFPFADSPEEILSLADEWKQAAKENPEAFNNELKALLPIDRLPGEDTIAQFQDKIRREGAAAASEVLSKALVDNPTTLPTIMGVELLGGPNKQQTEQFIKQTSESLIYENSHPLVVASFLVPVVGQEQATAMTTRVAYNAMLGGFTNAGLQVTLEQESSLKALSEDFAIGAFGGAALPEVFWAFSKTHLVEDAAGGHLRDYAAADVQRVLEESTPDGVRLSAAADGTIAVPGAPRPTAPHQTPVLTDPIAEVGLRPQVESARQARRVLEQEKLAAQAADDELRRLGERGIPAGGPLGDNAATAQLDAAAQRAADANQRVLDAQRAYRDLTADEAVREFAERVTNAQGVLPGFEEMFRAPELDAEVLRTITQQHEALVREALRVGDAATSPNRFRRELANVTGMFSGRLPGYLANTASSSMRLRSALTEIARPTVRRLSKEIDDVAKRNIDDARYIGPDRRAPYVKTEQAKLRDIVQHPEYWEGVAPELRAKISEYQALLNKKFNILREMGYNTADARENYLTQLWESDPADIRTAFAGRKSTAHATEFDDYVEGVEKGLTPRNLSLGQIFGAHDSMLNDALSDAFFRREIIERYATKGVGGITTGRRSFKTPLLKGYSAPRHIAEAVDSYFTTSGSVLRNTVSVSQRFKNTAFGLFDFAVFGVHLTQGLTHGGLPWLTATINDGLRMAHLPNVNVQALTDANPNRRVFAAFAGVRQGQAAYNLATSEGSVIGLIPGMRSLDEMFTHQWADRLASLQFDTILTPTRNRIFDGMLIINHLLGNDIAKPQVYESAARFANLATLTSEGAQRGTRRGIEQAAATSANAIRAELASFGQLSNLLLKGSLRRPERVNAMVALASMAFSLYAVNAAVSQSLGLEPELFNPFADGGRSFATIRISDKKRIPIIRERTILRAINKSIKGIMEEDPNYVVTAWTQFATSKSSPAAGALPAAAGIGFDQQGVFHTGDLPSEQRLLNIAPIAPIIDKLTTKQVSYTDPTTMGLEIVGFNTQNVPTRMRLDEYAKANNPYAPDDQRFQVVAELGYAGLEDAERMRLRSEHPELFESGNVSPEFKKTLDTLEKRREDLAAIEQKVTDDPFLRREYNDLRAEISSRTSAALGEFKEDKPQTIQAEAKQLYYNTIDEHRQAAFVEVLKGEDYGAAVDDARKRVLEKLGPDGLDALDRSLTAGQTALDTEYKTGMDAISKSGYYDLNDAAVRSFNKKHGTDFATYAEFRQESEDYARAKGIDPKNVGALKQLDSLIEDGKKVWREQHPDVDALLAIWFGNAPRSRAAAETASQVLQRKIELAGDVKDEAKREARKVKKQEGLAAVDINELIGSLNE